ncbi:hypothetical protein DSO57_1018403 [Entomophthora muscae]|uniref:Uncharacterized protein n=1 Tax=Entomophthora muscae TaxID=34485 RepID=A0ACC2ST13_9FUNG|nr:hypothetical protein DSO57_1018403 [Entomophthora muscae]
MQQNDTYFSFVFGPVEPVLGIDICMFVLGLVGFSINVLLLYMTFIYRKRSCAIDTTLIQIISLFDALTSLFMVVSILLRWTTGEAVLTNDGLWCRVSSIMFGGATLLTLVFAALLALVRYLVIARGWRINGKVFTFVSYVLVVFILTEFTYLAFRFRVTVPPSGLYCLPRFWEKDYSSRFVGVTTIALLVFTIFTIPMSYLGITLHYHKLIRDMGSSKNYEHVWRIRRSTNSLIVIVTCYFFAFFPEFLLVGVSVGGIVRRTNVLDGIVIFLLSSTTVINALFSLLLHDDIHRIFLRHLGLSRDILGQPLP